MPRCRTYVRTACTPGAQSTSPKTVLFGEVHRHGLHILSAVGYARRKGFRRDAEVLDSRFEDFVERL